jgi:hypothetical protein
VICSFIFLVQGTKRKTKLTSLLIIHLDSLRYQFIHLLEIFLSQDLLSAPYYPYIVFITYECQPFTAKYL